MITRTEVGRIKAMRGDERPRHPGVTLVTGCVAIWCGLLALAFLFGGIRW